MEASFLPIIIYKVLKLYLCSLLKITGFLPIIIYKVLKHIFYLHIFLLGFLPIIIYKVLKPERMPVVEEKVSYPS